MIALDKLSIESLAHQLAEELAPYPVTLAYLFGSAATGQMTPSRDVDISLVLDESPASIPGRLKLELALEAEIAERCGLGQADVRIINDAPLVLRGQVGTDGALLFARNHESRIDFETHTRADYFDFLPTAESARNAFFTDVRERGLDGQRFES